MQRLLIMLGLVIASIGALYPYLKQIGLGKSPGDIISEVRTQLLFPSDELHYC